MQKKHSLITLSNRVVVKLLRKKGKKDKMKEIIKNLKSLIKSCKKYKQNLDEADWGYEEGVLLSANEAQKILDKLSSQLEPQTDIEKQESIVTILSQLIDEIEQDDRIIQYRKTGESTAWERIAIHNTLEKLLALDNLKIIPIE